MLHLFVIHSHTTHRCALGIIRDKGLLAADCVFGTSRGFAPPSATSLDDPIPAVPLDFLGQPNGNAIRPVLRLRHLRKLVDQRIDQILDRKDFHAYLPHTYYDPYQLLATHPSCNGFSYIEEGLTSYYAPGEIELAYPTWRFKWRTRRLRNLMFGNRIREEIPFFRDDYSSAYGFTDRSFPQWPRMSALGMDCLFGENAPLTHAAPPVLVFDALVELGLTDLESLDAALRAFLDALISTGADELQFKFHPGQSPATSSERILECFVGYASRLKVHFMPADLSLEDYFGRHDSEIYVFNSAAGLYAALRGRQVRTLNPLIERHDPEYRSRTSRLPAVFHQLVPPIDLDRLGDH